MKFWLLAVMIPTVLFARTSTPQDKCSQIDLRNDVLGHVRDQGAISWCYAFAGADMLNYTFNEHEKISAADVAIGYNQTNIGLFMRWLDINLLHRNDTTIRGEAHQTGFNKKSLMNTLKTGWCPESVFPSEKWTKVSRTTNGWVEEQVLLGPAMLDIQKLHQIRRSLTPDNIPYYFKFKNVGINEFTKMVKSNFINSFYFELRKNVCKDDRHPFEHKKDVKMVIKNPWIFNNLSKELERGNVVGLDYDSRVLDNTSNHSLGVNQLHTSVIVGRRWNQERSTCEYLIRNSHGEQCQGEYDPTIECDFGNLWLSEDQIYRNMTSIVYMVEPKN